MTTKEQILALAGKPVAWKDTCFTSDENDQQSTDIVLLGYEGIDSLPDGTDLFTADQLIAIAKPLEDEIAELKQQLESYRADAECMNYVCSVTRCDPKMDGNHVYWGIGGRPLKGSTLRNAITSELIRMYGKPEMPKEVSDD